MRAFVLCLLLACTSNAEVRLSLNRVTSKASSRQAGSRLHATRHAKPLRSVLGVITEGFFDESYQVDVSVGTPPQRFNLTLDTNFEESFLFASDFIVEAHACPSYIVVTRRLFNASASSTFAVQNIDPVDISGFALEYPYCDTDTDNGEVFNFYFAADTFQVGGLSSQNASFVLAHKVDAPLSDDWPSDGIFGLALWDNAENPGILSAVRVLLKSAKQPIASTYLTRRKTGFNELNPTAVMDAGPVFFKCCDWILGTTFNFEYCHLLDYGNKRIAFAKALAPKSG